MDDIDAVGNAPPALNPVALLPAAGMAAILDAWAETQNVQENERLRADLTADIYRDRGELLAPYMPSAPSAAATTACSPAAAAVAAAADGRRPCGVRGLRHGTPWSGRGRATAA